MSTATPDRSTARPMAGMVIANKKKAELYDRQLRHASTKADLGLFAASLKSDQQTELKRRVQQRIEEITDRLQMRANLRRQHLDAGGVFAAKANEVRTQNMFLVELSQTLRIDDIQDAVLGEMRQELAEAEGFHPAVSLSNSLSGSQRGIRRRDGSQKRRTRDNFASSALDSKFTGASNVTPSGNGEQISNSNLNSTSVAPKASLAASSKTSSQTIYSRRHGHGHKHDIVASLAASLEEATQKSLRYYPAVCTPSLEHSSGPQIALQQSEAVLQDEAKTDGTWANSSKGTNQAKVHDSEPDSTAKLHEPQVERKLKNNEVKQGGMGEEPQQQEMKPANSNSTANDGGGTAQSGGAESEMWQETSFLSRKIAQNTLGGMRSKKLELYKKSDVESSARPMDLTPAGTAAKGEVKLAQMREEERAASEEQVARLAEEARLARRAARLKAINDKQERMRQQQANSMKDNMNGEDEGDMGLGGEGYQSRLGLQESPFMPALRHAHGNSIRFSESPGLQQAQQQQPVASTGTSTVGGSGILSYAGYKSERAALNSYAAGRLSKHGDPISDTRSEMEVLSPIDMSAGMVGGHGLAMSLGVGGQMSAMLKSQSSSALPMTAKIFKLVHLPSDKTKPGGQLQLAGQEGKEVGEDGRKRVGDKGRDVAVNGTKDIRGKTIPRWHWASGVDQQQQNDEDEEDEDGLDSGESEAGQKEGDDGSGVVEEHEGSADGGHVGDSSRRQSISRARNKLLSRGGKAAAMTDSEEFDYNRRLERIWDKLQMPFTQRLGILDKYSLSAKNCTQLFDAVPVWETATERIGHREVLVNVYRKLARAVQLREKERVASLQSQTLIESDVVSATMIADTKADSAEERNVAALGQVAVSEKTTPISTQAEEEENEELRAIREEANAREEAKEYNYDVIPDETLIYLKQYGLYVKKPTLYGLSGETEARERPHVWLHRMIINVTSHCTEVLNRLQDEFGDSVTYRGNDYAKLIAMTTTSTGDKAREKKETAEDYKAGNGENEEAVEGSHAETAPSISSIPEVDLQIDKALLTPFPYTGNTFIQRSQFL